jgi:hypothetical protein
VEGKGKNLSPSSPPGLPRGVYPELDPSVASLPQDDKGEGLPQDDKGEGLSQDDRGEGLSQNDRKKNETAAGTSLCDEKIGPLPEMTGTSGFNNVLNEYKTFAESA